MQQEFDCFHCQLYCQTTEWSFNEPESQLTSSLTPTPPPEAQSFISHRKPKQPQINKIFSGTSCCVVPVSSPQWLPAELFFSNERPAHSAAAECTGKCHLWLIGFQWPPAEPRRETLTFSCKRKKTQTFGKPNQGQIRRRLTFNRPFQGRFKL